MLYDTGNRGSLCHIIFFIDFQRVSRSATPPLCQLPACLSLCCHHLCWPDTSPHSGVYLFNLQPTSCFAICFLTVLCLPSYYVYLLSASGMPNQWKPTHRLATPTPHGYVLNFGLAPKDEVFPHVQKSHSWGIPHAKILALLKKHHIDTEKYGLGYVFQNMFPCLCS